MTELDVFAKFKRNGHEWTIEWIGQTHQPHIKVLIGSVMARGKKQLMLFTHSPLGGFAPTSWSGQYSSKEIRGRRDQLQEEQQEIPMMIKKFAEFLYEGMDKSLDRAMRDHYDDVKRNGSTGTKMIKKHKLGHHDIEIHGVRRHNMMNVRGDTVAITFKVNGKKSTYAKVSKLTPDSPKEE